MRFGTYYFLQAPPHLTHPEVVRREIEQMVWTEELGFDSIWLTEHHFIEYGLSVSPSVLAAAAAMRTQRVRIGLAAAILPFHDPIRLAEELAMVDILSGGRLDVGVGRGNRPVEFAGYRVPQIESRERELARPLGRVAAHLRRADRRSGAGRGEGCRALVPGGAAPFPDSRTDRHAAPAPAAGIPDDAGTAGPGHLGAARRRNAGLRVARDGGRQDRAAATARRRRGAVLDELRRPAPG